jgi:hypothetical protein
MIVSNVNGGTYSIEGLSIDDLRILFNVINSAPLPDKRVLYSLKNEIKRFLTNA